jgi:hypothetical protein
MFRDGGRWLTHFGRQVAKLRPLTSDHPTLTIPKTRQATIDNDNDPKAQINVPIQDG